MVVLQVQLVCVTALEPKCDSPVSRDGNRPCPFSRPFHLVEIPSREIHIRHILRCIENVKLTSDSRSVLRRDASKISRLKEPLQALVAKVYDHR